MAEYDDDMLLENLRELLRNRPTGSRSSLRPKQDEFKVTELPEFTGGTNPEDYLEWERKIERMFDFKDLSDGKRCKYAILKLSKGASLWFEGLKSKRTRTGKEKITSWDSLKRKLRKRYVPATHRLTLYRKIADLVQGKLSISEYIDEFEKLALMGELEENEEQKMSRFLRGLNRNIANSVELYPYADFDTLCGLCVKIEAQGKSRYGSSSGEYSSSGGWSKPETSEVGGSTSVSISGPKSIATTVATSGGTKTVAPVKEQSLTKVRCFKCQGFGHYQNACPNKRVVTLREAVAVRDDLPVEEDESLGGVFNLNEVEEDELDVVAYEAPNYDVSLVIRSLQVQSEPIRPETEQRDQLFHTKCQVNDRWCSVIIDGGSCTNAASSEMVTKLALPTTVHPKPYALHWLNDGKKVQVSKQVRVCFTMGSYVDEVLCDVVPMDACHVLLGRPWQYDRDVLHKGKTNEYELLDKGKRVVLRPMSSDATRAMRSNGKKNSSLTMLALEGKFDEGLDKDELWSSGICSSLDFNLPPVFDEYEDDGACDATAKRPYHLSNFGQKFGKRAAPFKHTIDAHKFPVHQCFYLVDFQVPRAAAIVKVPGCSMGSIDNTVRDEVSRLVHGGWWGGWHKDILQSNERDMMRPCREDGSSVLFGFVIFVFLFLLFFFGTGEFKHLELRSIPFKGRGDDTGNSIEDSFSDNLILAVGFDTSLGSMAGSMARYVCLLSSNGTV